MKALVISGGVPQIELIKQLHVRGIQALVADISPNPVAKPYSDKFFLVKPGIEEIEKIAIDEKVDFVITVCADQVILDMAGVSEKLNLPCYIDYKTAQDVSNKIKMKDIFFKYNIPSTKYVKSDAFNLKALEQLHMPLVVKPVDSFSSKGVRKAYNIEELKQYYEEAKAISRSGGVIVEEFFEGEEISVDAFVIDGKAHVITISNSDKIKDKDRFIIFRGRYPAMINDTVRAKIEVITQKIAEAFKLVNSPLLIQFITNGEDVSVLEFCARTGGNMKYILIKYSSGVDVIGATIDITLGQEPDLSPQGAVYNVVVNDFIYCHPGIFDHFEGFKEMESFGVINEFHPARTKGTQISGAMSSRDRIAGMNIVADTIQQYNEKLSIINQNVKVIDTNGNDIMRHELLCPLQLY